MIRIYEDGSLSRADRSDIYKCWKYLLDNPELKTKDLFDAFPKLTYLQLKQGVDCGALLKVGRTYFANPEFQFETPRVKNKNKNNVAEQPYVQKSPSEIRSEPSMQKIGNITRFAITDDDYDDEFAPKDVLIHGDTLELGNHTWTRIGEMQGHDLYICDDIITHMAFTKRGGNVWSTSDVRKWLNNTFYKSLSDDEKEVLTKNIELDDNIFILSKQEYNTFNNKISNIDEEYWTRSQGYGDKKRLAYITQDGAVDNFGGLASYSDVGVRPVVLV